jgi:hypothetical protein
MGLLLMASRLFLQAGTRVTIEGERLLGEQHGSRVADVTLAGVPATLVQGSSQNQVIVIARESPDVATGDVVVVADSGAQATFTASWYRQLAPAPHTTRHLTAWP